MKKLATICIFVSSMLLLSFLQQPAGSASAAVRQYYTDHLEMLAAQLTDLRASIVARQPIADIHRGFVDARIQYKQLELILEYYFEGDALRFNGLPTAFIEEEDPAAYQEPQGFQRIEQLLYPRPDSSHQAVVLDYIDRLISLSRGLAANPALLDPGRFMPDAIMEELYRILALGISGFDSPLARCQLPETIAALSGVKAVVQLYQPQWKTCDPLQYNNTIRLLSASIQYIRLHDQADRFNSMEFIVSCLNPLCDALAVLKKKGHFPDNEARYSLLKKSGHLFRADNLDLQRYLYDDSITPTRVQLGKALFYEPMLSANGRRSCAGCHQPGKAFTDGLPTARNLDEHGSLPRNTSTLWNAALQLNLFYDSRQLHLNDVVLEVLNNAKEMNSGADTAVAVLAASKRYAALFGQAYPAVAQPVSAGNAARAIAAYLRTLVSYRSRFDQYMRGRKNALSSPEIAGFNVFMGKAKCATCHYLPFFNGTKPPVYYYQESEVIGVPATNDTAHAVIDPDHGRFNILQQDFLDHAFKTPTLRNIALTAPYMHNGVFKTLDEVIDFYDKGGGHGLGIELPNQTLPPDPLQLTPAEKKVLKAFLLTLTDTSGHFSKQ